MVQKSGIHLLLGSFFPTIYHGFYTSQVVAWDFWTISSIKVGLVFSFDIERIYLIVNQPSVKWIFHESYIRMVWDDMYLNVYIYIYKYVY